VIVVSNTTPIIKLAGIGSLDILKSLFGNIYIPSAVFFEITNYQQPGSQEVKTYDWIIHNNIKNTDMYHLILAELDAGESAAITLASEMNADLLLIDEKNGRIVADQLDLKKTGTVGILQIAKKKNLIPSVKPLLDDLISKTGFWIHKDLYNQILIDSNEKS
jgi:predicted nucleic acid-binding protein